MDDDRLVVDGHEFVLSPMQGTRDPEGPFVLKKPRWMVDRYLRIAEEYRGSNIVELGLWDGGSTAFLASTFQPRSLVGFDLSTNPLPRLERFLEGSPLRERVHVALGVEQSDTATLRRIIIEHLDGPIDVVIDDASHLLGPTASTFDCLFPMLRPGGVYIIEDWSHDHQLAYGIRQGLASGVLTAEGLGTSIPAEPLSRLILDIVLATANGDGIVADIHVRQGFAEVRRGDTETDPHGFSLRDLIGEIGRLVSPRPRE